MDELFNDKIEINNLDNTININFDFEDKINVNIVYKPYYYNQFQEKKENEILEIDYVFNDIKYKDYLSTYSKKQTAIEKEALKYIYMID